jgi:hypothetical protein
MIVNLLTVAILQIHGLILSLVPEAPWMGYGLVIFGLILFVRNWLQKGPLPSLKRAIWFPALFTIIFFAMHSAVALSTRF